MSLKKTVLFFLILVCLSAYGGEYFKGYSAKDIPSISSIFSILKPKYNGESKWNENYFHEAQFPDQGITIFTNVIFSKGFFGKKGCKFNCIITFNNDEKYVFNQDYDDNEFQIQNKGFGIYFGNNMIELKQEKYLVKLEDNNIKLNLTYKISSPPHVFGDGKINIDSKNFLAFTQPIIGAYINGTLEYKNKIIKLKGRGSVGHDYNSILPVNNPKKWRSFWLYNSKYSINIDTVILSKKMNFDRVVITKNGNYLVSFLNCGLKAETFIMDEENNFKYPTKYSIDYTDDNGNSIKADIKLRSFTDKIQVFKNLSPSLYTIVKNTVGEMWAYRFWSDAEFTIGLDNGREERINISGIGNFVDTDKSTKKE